MDMKLELVPIPVADLDRVITFYVDQLGFTLDHDTRPNETIRIVQLTPPGSACSIVLSTGLPGLAMPVGSQRGLHLVVGDAAKAGEVLASRGVAVSDGDDLGGVKYAHFSDPDGNTRVLQAMPWRAAEFT
jgi:catechol 2,3-dioxygenase-like lactoylglutathione lyase family enzyme